MCKTSTVSRLRLDGFSATRKELTASLLADLRRALNEGDLDSLFRHLRVFFADIPYDIPLSNEKYYQTIFYLVFRIVGLDVDCEVRTEAGRIDAVVKTGAKCCWSAPRSTPSPATSRAGWSSGCRRPPLWSFRFRFVS